MGNDPKRVHPPRLQSETGTAWNRVNTRPTSLHATVYCFAKRMSHPFISPFLRDNDPQVHVPSANYTLGRIQVQFGGLRSGWDQSGLGGIRGTKAPEELCGGKRVFFFVSAGACFMPFASSSTAVVVICA